jgi:hypothetical protein
MTAHRLPHRTLVWLRFVQARALLLPSAPATPSAAPVSRTHVDPCSHRQASRFEPVDDLLGQGFGTAADPSVDYSCGPALR